MKVWLVALLFACTTLAQAEVWHFGLIGDVPYTDDERRELPRMLNAVSYTHLTLPTNREV